MRFHDHFARASRLALVLPIVAAVSTAAAADDNRYVQRNLVSDDANAVPAENTDPNLVNPWGLVFNPFAFAWVADNGTGVSTLYDGNGNLNPPLVAIPGGKPTGIVYSGSQSDFVVTKGMTNGPSRFIFATETGVIAGWAPNVDPNNAIEAYTSPSGAIFKGLALANAGTASYLYATDFHNGVIVVLDHAFQPQQLAGSFEDPNLPPHYAPFGIQNLNGDLYVTYAMQDEDAEDDVAGFGRGFVDVFTPEGELIRRVASGPPLNAPWGLAIAPANFGRFHGRLLVGNFGNGRINAFDLATNQFMGMLRRPNGTALSIDGLWAIVFGNGLKDQPADVLFFTAGPGDESHGLYGSITPQSNTSSKDDGGDSGAN
jgi:uncharacterized protein (TIGR03118 family)